MQQPRELRGRALFVASPLPVRYWLHQRQLRLSAGYVPPGCTQPFPCFDFGPGGRSFCADAQRCPHGKPPSELEHFPAQLPGSCMCEAGYTGDLCEERSTPPDTGGTCAAYYEVLPGMGVHTASDMCVVQSLSLP